MTPMKYQRWLKNGYYGMDVNKKPRVFHDKGTLTSKIAEFSNGKPHNVRAVLLTLAGAEGEGLSAVRELTDLCRAFAKEHESQLTPASRRALETT